MAEQATREPRPAPLTLVLMIVAFLGSTCAARDVTIGQFRVPEKSEVEQAYAQVQGKPGSQQDVDVMYAALVEMVQVVSRYRRYDIFFGILLLIAYTFTAVCALKAWHYLPGAHRWLSTACLIVLPPRVAAAAVSVAEDRGIAKVLASAVPAMTEAMERAAAENKVPVEEVRQGTLVLVDLIGYSLVGFHLLLLAVVGALFTLGWRYYQRPDVIAYFEKRAAAR